MSLLKVRKSQARFLASLVVICFLLVNVGCAPVDVEKQAATHSDSFVDHETILKLLDSADPELICREVEENWHPGTAAMLLEIVRFNQNSKTGRAVLNLLKKQTGQNFKLDMNAWYQWIWNRPYDPHPEYAEFKKKIYVQVDSSFTEYFVETDNAEIRLDEIRWGGVRRDGIPPLKNPKMVSSNEASFLADSDVVFGIAINGDVRCYPKRILAWHEMFKDTIGGKPICGAY